MTKVTVITQTLALLPVISGNGNLLSIHVHLQTLIETISPANHKYLLFKHAINTNNMYSFNMFK